MKKRIFLLLWAVFATLLPLMAQDQGDEPEKPAYVPVDETQLLIEGDEAAGAAGNGADQDGASVTVPGLRASDFLKMLFFLGLMILLIYGFFLLLRKMSGRNLLQSELIRIRGSRVLKGDAVLHIVEIGQSLYVIGTAGQSVSLVTEITDKETADEIRLRTPELPATEGNDFLRKLAARLKSPVSGKKIEETAGEGAEFIREQRDRLKGL